MSEKDRTVRTTLMETFSFLPRGQVWKMLIGKSWKREREREDGPRKACPRIRRWHKRASDGVSFGSATACCNSDDDNSLPLSLFPYNKKKKKRKRKNERNKRKKHTNDIASFPVKGAHPSPGVNPKRTQLHPYTLPLFCPRCQNNRSYIDDRLLLAPPAPAMRHVLLLLLLLLFRFTLSLSLSFSFSAHQPTEYAAL